MLGGTIFSLGLFCGIIALVLYGFLGYHLWLVKQNITTNETYKWSDYRRYVAAYITAEQENNRLASSASSASSEGTARGDSRKTSKRLTQVNSSSGSQKNANAHSSLDDVDGNDNNGNNNKNDNNNDHRGNDMKRSSSGGGGGDVDAPFPPPQYKLDSNGHVLIRNKYDKGVVANFWDVLSPPSLRRHH